MPEKIDLEGDIRKENNKDTYTQIVVSETDSSDNGFLNYMLNINYDRKKFTGFHMQAFGTTKELPVKSIGCAVILLDSLDLDYERAASFLMIINMMMSGQRAATKLISNESRF
ncbi:hypothetical protein [Bacillus atrophaeus]|uniref:hypothetical protein n=1 Tax=Bacillus atrophaeus TaxID=1452 RepID=UPI0018F737D1|nr:hypothetical protein [Bacillus atrophaeus]MBJ7897991.1 hypothetical protein [Bacillus atrophaeus]